MPRWSLIVPVSPGPLKFVYAFFAMSGASPEPSHTALYWNQRFEVVTVCTSPSSVVIVLALGPANDTSTVPSVSWLPESGA